MKLIPHFFKGKTLPVSNDSFAKTMVVAFLLCLVCSILVSGSAVALRPMQENNKSLDVKKNILSVAGLLDEDVNIDEAFQQIEAKIVELETGVYIDSIDIVNYNQRKAAKDPEFRIEISPKDDIANIKRKAKYAKVYLVKKDDQIDAFILPVHGYGLWSTMYGFLALEADGQTVIGLNFYDQAETPGLGGEIVNPKWLALWKGKKVYNQDGVPILGLVKGHVDLSKPGSESQVDGLAGATLTSQGVTNLIRYWMGRDGFSPFLEKIKLEKG